MGNKVFITPFLKEIITDNPFKKTRRSLPVDLTYPIKKSYSSTIKIPDGYKLEYAPENEEISNDQFDLKYEIVSQGQQLTVNLSYYVKDPVYPAGDYLKLRYLFNEIIKKGNDKIVLSKI